MEFPINGVNGSVSTEVNSANLNLLPTSLTRRSSYDSVTSSHTARDLTTAQHHFRSLYHIHQWRNTAERHELIALGYARMTRKVLGWDEVKAEFARVPKLRRTGWAGVLPVTGGSGIHEQNMGTFVGYTIKGVTW